ncbi:hypothetical protein PQQ75_25625 [Paraburkholderia aspalathi]|uniref:hypothetical protein n=1 Tax=Paraburkholderia aspalathi TaxID=1324617 RepID=UPI0038BD5F82
MRTSSLLKLLLAAAFPMFATEDETASAAPSSTEPAADAVAAPVADATVATDAPAAAATQVQIDPPAVVLDTATVAPAVDASAPVADAPAADEVAPEAPAASDAPPVDGTPVETGEGEAVVAAPTVQTPTPVAQSGDAGDPVLETVKTPAHSVADEIQEQIKNLEQLPAEVAAWFESKFVELAGHIKALL